MPSFRVTLTVGLLRPGVDPSSIVPAAAAAARTLTTVEASDLAVVSGAARVTVRFTAEDAELAHQIGEYVASQTSRSANVDAWKVTERVGARWYVVR
jgi:hypothetical protein